MSHLIREIVAGRAVHRPIFPQRLNGGENFLDDHVHGAAILRQRRPQRLRTAPLQFLEIFLRQIKTIRMIDAQSGDRADADKIEQKFVRLVKNFRQFHPNRGEIIDVKKPAIINFFRGNPPERQPVGLRVEQLIECVKAACGPRLSVDLPQRIFDCLLHFRRLRATAFQTALDDFLLADALRDAPWIGFSVPRQILERSHDALELSIKILTLVFGQILERDVQDVSISARRDRQLAIVVAKIKSALLKPNAQLAPFEHASVLIA